MIIELLTEVYGLVTGPPGWRKSLMGTLKSLGFKNHPLAPCVVCMYETHNGEIDALTGMICVETDDLMGGGVGECWFNAISQLRKRYNFGKWTELMEKSTEYGGRTLKQHKDYSVNISMVRYLQERARQIHLERGRCKTPEAEATADEITAMRGLCGKLN